MKTQYYVCEKCEILSSVNYEDHADVYGVLHYINKDHAIKSPNCRCDGIRVLISQFWPKIPSTYAEAKSVIDADDAEKARMALLKADNEKRNAERAIRIADKIADLGDKTKNQLLSEFFDFVNRKAIMKSWSKHKIIETLAYRIVE